MFNDAIKALTALLFGPSFVSSAVGLAVAVATEAALAADKIQGYGWHLVALGFYALARVVQDHFQKAPAPVDPPAPPAA